MLLKLKRAAENYLGEKVTDAVITVPAYFNDSQRQATKDAGEIAGLNVRRIVNEPTAAALAYGLDRKKNEKIAVYDFGGGTFDISILEVGENVVEVLATNGDTHLGGDNIDQQIIDWLIAEFKKDTGIDVAKDKMVLQRLKEAAEKAKIELSSTMETEINLPFLTADQTGPKHLSIKLSRARLEQLVEELINRSIEPTRRCLADAKLQPSRDRRGGAGRWADPHAEDHRDREEDLRQGAQPHRQSGRGGGGRRGRAGRRALRRGEGHPPARRHPAVPGGRDLGGVMTRLIERNTTIPAKRSETFSTAADSQTSVEIHVLQGEREMSRDNRTLGRFHLEGLPPAPRGLPQIEVTFDIDANGILNVFAKDKGTGKETKITITHSSGLNKGEVEKMVTDAKDHEAEDKKRRDEVEQRNRAENLAYQMEKLLKENKDKLGEAVAKEVEQAVEEVHRVREKGTPEEVKAAMERLEKASHKAAEELYKSAPGGEPPPGGEAPPKTEEKPKDNVVDAEFKQV